MTALPRSATLDGMHATRRRLVTEEEFLQLPESNLPTELIDGEVRVAPAPSFWHQRVAGRLFFELERWAREKSGFTVVLSPIDIRFRRQRILQPDIAVFDKPIPRDQKGPIEIIPTLCVEVVSDTMYDRVTKRLVYAAAGVPEYWCVDQNGAIEVWTGEDLGANEFYAETLTSPRLPDFSVNIPALFQD